MKFEKFPAIMGATYINTSADNFKDESVLICADIRKDEFILKNLNTMYYWIGNHDSFSYYWRLKE